MSRLTLALALSLSVFAACSPATHESAPAQPLPPRGTTRDAPAPVEARWVPLVAPMPTRDRFPQHIYGPVQTNEGTHATVYLARSTVGVVDKSKRWVWKEGVITPVPGDDSARALDTVDPVAPAAGGGFVFTGKDGVFYASSFDAPLVLLSRDPKALRAIGPHGVFLQSGFVAFDGKPIPTAPKDASDMQVHPAGFGVAETPAGLFFSADGRRWKALGPIAPKVVTVDGDALIAVGGSSDTVRITRDGAVTRVKLTDEARMGLAMTAGQPDAPPDDGFEGSIAERMWLPSGKDDAWFRVKDRDILVKHGHAGAPQRIAAAPADGCMPLVLERPLVVCMDIGQRLRVYHLEVATGALSLERDVQIKQGGLARFMGVSRGMWPPALYITASCDGDPEGGTCVRDDHGGWRTLAMPKDDARVLVFPGEIVHMTEGPHGEWEMHSASALESSFRPPPSLVPDKGAKLEDLKVTNLGALRTADEVVWFMGPNPFAPIVSPESYAIHFPVGSGARAAVMVSVPGVVAVAGMNALRLDEGRLYETEDGWKTWREVAPPPTGPLADLAGAMCFDRGCVVGAWMRVGWTH